MIGVHLSEKSRLDREVWWSVAQSMGTEGVFGGRGTAPSHFYGAAKAVDVLGIYISWLVALDTLGPPTPAAT